MEALLLLIDRVERMHAKSEEAMNTAYASRTALASALQAKDPELAKKFQDFLDRFQAVAGRYSVDPQLDEMRRRLSELLPK